MSLDSKALPSTADVATTIDLNVCPGVRVGASSKTREDLGRGRAMAGT